MAKRKNDLPANDYIDQLQWQANHSRRRWVSIRFEPKWKYKIVYRNPQTSPFGKVSQFLLFIAVIFIIIQFISSGILTANPIATTIIGTILVLATIIIFFAIRDGSKDENDDIDKLD